ncbi:hypothetical protein DL767_004360 [Monosporascus sp. MG133]|nr:hypothetical protein DL767_004360 [Monosporascus sp. MG133]
MRLFSPAAVYLTTLLSTVSLAAYDQNRAGAVLKAPEGDSFTSVTGTFTVPALTGNARLSIWVAIGDTLQQDVVLKGGVHFASNALSSFVAWAPGSETDITSEVPVRARDTVKVTVSVPADDKSTGTVLVENTTQNRRTTQTVPVPASADPSTLTSLAADWFVQAYQQNFDLPRVPRFGTLTFTACSATLASGQTVGTTGAGIFEIQGTSGQIYSRTTASGNTVTVTQSM